MIAFALLFSTLSYEVLVRWPRVGPKGEEGWIASDFLGFTAQPVRLTGSDDGSVSEMLYLGSNADLYVLVDPGNGDRVDHPTIGRRDRSGVAVAVEDRFQPVDLALSGGGGDS
jgi:hypothetical protein